MTDGAAPNPSFAIEFARATHANLQEMVKVADAKATTLVAIQTLSLGLVFSALKALSPLAALFFFVTVLSMGAAIGVLIPRFPRFAKRPLHSNGLLWIESLNDFATGPDLYIDALRALTPEQALGEFGFENLKIAFLLKKKFWWLRIAVWSLLISVLVLFVLVVSHF